MTSLVNLNTKVLKKGDPEPAALSLGQIRVYSMRFCPWAERAILTLSYKRIPAEVINIHLSDKPEWYLKKHPEGKVPAMEIDGEITIESGLIPEYLDFKYPERPILPTDPYLRFQQKLLTEQLSGLSTTYYGLNAAVKDPSLVEEKYKAVKDIFDKAESFLKDRFYGGDQLAYADLMCFSFFERHYWMAMMGLSPLDGKEFPGKKDYPKLTEYFQAVSAIPEIKGAIQPAESFTAFITSLTSGFYSGDYDAGL